MQTRRRFLDVLLGTAFAGTVASVLYPIVRYLKPLPTHGPGGPTKLTDAELETLQRKHFVIVPVAGKRVIVFRDPESRLHALDARCTHEGCTVQYVEASSLIWCACHNGRFDVDGRVLSGPPPRPLGKLVARQEEDGSVVIAPENA